MWKIRNGKVRIVENDCKEVGDKVIHKHIYEGMRKAAREMERKYDDLGPWNDFEWGMINGKLSALRWVLGDEWDNLDT
jgi:hypothetical protein